jgi:hypothetical protein
MESNNNISMGTASGTLLSMMPNIASEDIAKTVILAGLGATVSFLVSLLLKFCTKSRKKH